MKDKRHLLHSQHNLICDRYLKKIRHCYECLMNDLNILSVLLNNELPKHILCLDIDYSV